MAKPILVNRQGQPRRVEEEEEKEETKRTSHDEVNWTVNI